jgi:simple sugar transport system permease protein
LTQTSTLRRIIAAPEFGPFVLLILEIAVFAAINPAFLSPLNISNTLTFTVELGLIALAMTLLMTSGEFDLSVGSVFGFAPVVMWTLFNAGLTSLFVGFVVALLISAAIGLFNGLFVTRLKIPSFLVTLGMLLVVRGVNVNAVRVWLFVLSAVMSAFAGVISSIRTSAANPNSGMGYELEVIAMVVIGGTALTGGRGTILGTVLGILILRVMRNGIVLIGVPGLAYNIFIGAIILGMMALHSWLERRHQAGT